MTTKTSSSLHSINADKGLNTPGRMVYWAANALNNTRPYANLDPKLQIRDFVLDDLDTQMAVSHGEGNSPSRKLCNLVWVTLPWAKIRAELGGETHVFDTGCGKGGYGTRLVTWYAPDYVDSYTGVDIREHPDWANLEAKYPNFHLNRCDSADITPCIPDGMNFFMSQSAIEHFDKDLLYFRQVRDYIQRYHQQTGKPVIQVHQMPSAATLRTYRTHGVRQYTPRTVSNITRLFTDFSDAVLFRLGGAACNRLHFEYITQPRIPKTSWIGGWRPFRGLKMIPDRRDENPEEYEAKALEAIRADMQQPQQNPAFYALVIHAYPQTKLF